MEQDEDAAEKDKARDVACPIILCIGQLHGRD
jgi:hypothetical protein